MIVTVLSIFRATIVVLLIAFPGELLAAESAGKVLVTRNQADALRAGTVLALARKEDVYSGDLVRTGAESRLGLRFVDGSIVTLDESSRVQIREYSYQQKERPDSFVIELVSGGFRNLTGAISKINPDAYRVTTPLASLSIRGTYYYTSIGEDQTQLSAYVWQGEVEVANEMGSVRIGPDQEFQGAVVNEGQAPKGTNALDVMEGLGTEFAAEDVSNDPTSPSTGNDPDSGNQHASGDGLLRGLVDAGLDTDSSDLIGHDNLVGDLLDMEVPGQGLIPELP